MPCESSRDQKLLGTREDIQYLSQSPHITARCWPLSYEPSIAHDSRQGRLPLLSGVGTLHAQS